MTNEESLLSAIRRGDRGAQRELYGRYAGVAMSVSMRYLANSEDARDVLQDSFVKVFTSIGNFRYRGEGSLKAWITRIVANESVSYLRRESHLHFVSDEDIADDHEYQTASADEEEEPDIGDLTAEALVKLIGQLPPGYRAVLNLFALEGRSHAEIGRQLGISASTSASQYLRAKQALAKMIRNYQNKANNGKGKVDQRHA